MQIVCNVNPWGLSNVYWNYECRSDKGSAQEHLAFLLSMSLHTTIDCGVLLLVYSYCKVEQKTKKPWNGTTNNNCVKHASITYQISI